MAEIAEIATIHGYLAAVRADLRGLRRRDSGEALAELESLLADRAAMVGESAALEALGDPHEYARSIREALRGAPAGSEEAETEPQGRVLGMPYDFRGASVERISSRVWNPADPRIFTPRLFGVGWTINFGALAVKLGLLRPDDVGDEAFEHIPAGAVRVALAIPAILAVATLVVIAASWRGLPAEVPVHWGFSGAPDDWASKSFAFGLILVIAVLPVLVMYNRVLRRGVPSRSRVLWSAALSPLSTIGLGLAVMTVADADGGTTGGYMWIVIVAGLALSFLLLYVPIRLGLRVDWRESLGGNEKGTGDGY